MRRELRPCRFVLVYTMPARGAAPSRHRGPAAGPSGQGTYRRSPVHVYSLEDIGGTHTTPSRRRRSGKVVGRDPLVKEARDGAGERIPAFTRRSRKQCESAMDRSAPVESERFYRGEVTVEADRNPRHRRQPAGADWGPSSGPMDTDASTVPPFTLSHARGAHIYVQVLRA